MKRFDKKIALDELQKLLGGSLVSRQSDIQFDNVAELDEANLCSVCFYQNRKYEEILKISEAGLIIVPLDFDKSLNQKSNLLYTENPYFTFLILLTKWLQFCKIDKKPGIHKSAIISESASVDNNAIIEENVVIKDNVIIGPGVVIESNSVIMDNCRIGEGSHIFPNVTIYHDTIIENNVTIHAGSVIGADGFGYVPYQGIQQKIPQVGKVVIEKNVEIGANTTIDRATLGTTVIGEGTKIDNLVQIGHNCSLGKNNILCAQVGLAGNTVIKNNVYLAGQVGVAGHLIIHDDVKIGAQSGVNKSVREGSMVLGSPAIDASLQKRILVALKKLPDILNYLNKFLKK